MGVVDTVSNSYSEISASTLTYKFSGAAAVGTRVYFAPYVRTPRPHPCTSHAAATMRVCCMCVAAVLYKALPAQLASHHPDIVAAVMDPSKCPSPAPSQPPACPALSSRLSGGAKECGHDVRACVWLGLWPHGYEHTFLALHYLERR